MTENSLSHKIVGAAIEVHRQLGGPGLLECVYEEALAYELDVMGLSVERQRALPVVYKGVALEKRFFIDLLVEDLVVVEVKAVEKFNPVFASQLLTYLRLGDYRLGLLLNFGDSCLKNGIRRVANKCPQK